MKTTIAGLLLAGLMLSPAAQAEIRYSFLEASYLDINRSEFEPRPLDEQDGHGFDLGASLGITDHMFLFMDYRELDLNHDIDVTLWNPGVGLHLGLTDWIDVILKGGYAWADIDSPLVDASDDGINAGMGIRLRLLKVFEVELGATYYSLDMTSGDEINYNAALRYYFTKALAFQAGVILDSDREPTWMAGFRTEFANLFRRS
jgi:hypothetical protein